jgi:hypothetical protein
MLSTPLAVTSVVRWAFSQEYATKEMAPEVVDLGGLRAVERAHQAGQVEQVTGQDLHVRQQLLQQRELGVVLTADQAVDLVALAQQQLGQVQPVLPGDAGDQCALHPCPSLARVWSSLPSPVVRPVVPPAGPASQPGAPGARPGHPVGGFTSDREADTQRLRPVLRTALRTADNWRTADPHWLDCRDPCPAHSPS